MKRTIILLLALTACLPDQQPTTTVQQMAPPAKQRALKMRPQERSRYGDVPTRTNRSGLCMPCFDGRPHINLGTGKVEFFSIGPGLNF